ncbi:MbtH family protein [Streptomyces xinghaiensis]|uniref:MbtH family protein n=1 Tax=Streptomyces xinghaiensis TaxID=1038928 RepID=UPI003449CA6C
MSNPFESEHGEYTVLVNTEGQYSLFPASAAGVPEGWRRVLTGSRQTCTDHIGENWTDMRPQSLARPR